MREIPDFVDDRNRTWCIHCARTLSDVKVTRDHVPTKTILFPPYPANLPVIPVCHDCNQSFSNDEQYLVALLSTVITGSTDPDLQINPNAKKILGYNHKLRAQIESSRQEQLNLWGPSSVTWFPDHKRIENVILKNARGHAFFEYGEPMLNDPTSVTCTTFLAMSTDDRARFEEVPSNGLWPEVGSRMMSRLFSGKDLSGPWVIVQQGVYRYSVTQSDRLLVRSVMNEYLATEVSWQ